MPRCAAPGEWAGTAGQRAAAPATTPPKVQLRGVPPACRLCCLCVSADLTSLSFLRPYVAQPRRLLLREAARQLLACAHALPPGHTWLCLWPDRSVPVRGLQYWLLPGALRAACGWLLLLWKHFGRPNCWVRCSEAASAARPRLPSWPPLLPYTPSATALALAQQPQLTTASLAPVSTGHDWRDDLHGMRSSAEGQDHFLRQLLPRWLVLHRPAERRLHSGEGVGRVGKAWPAGMGACHGD